VVGELPMFALIFTRAFSPIAIGSRAAWWTLAGRIIRPRATSPRISSAGRNSRSAKRSISGEMTPARASRSCVRQSAWDGNAVRLGMSPPYAGVSQVRFGGWWR